MNLPETKSKVLVDFLIPIVLLSFFTLLFNMTNLDIVISYSFFNDGFDKEAKPWIYFYDYGMIPVWISIVVSFNFLLQSFICSKCRYYRKNALFVILFISLGAGLVVNLILKENTGRPRPVQCTVFKGDYEFKKVLTYWKTNTDNKSFPSGHAAGAFSMIFPYFIYRGRNKKLAYLALVGGTLYGILVGLARIAQGGHFASDIIWSFGIIYLVGLILFYVLKFDGIKKAD